MKSQKRIVKKLDLGSGDRKQAEPDWIYCDLYRTEALTENDIVHDVTTIDEVVEANCVEQLRATHLIEHFSHRQTLSLLQTWHSIMAEGGQIYLETPNFAYHAQLLLDGRHEEALRYCFGGQLDDGDYHKTAFTVDTITRYLELAGFKDIKVIENTSLTVTAIK